MKVLRFPFSIIDDCFIILFRHYRFSPFYLRLPRAFADYQSADISRASVLRDDCFRLRRLLYRHTLRFFSQFTGFRRRQLRQFFRLRHFAIAA